MSDVLRHFVALVFTSCSTRDRVMDRERSLGSVQAGLVESSTRHRQLTVVADRVDLDFSGARRAITLGGTRLAKRVAERGRSLGLDRRSDRPSRQFFFAVR